MNIVQFDWCAFILPDDMEAFRKRYGADVIFINGEDGSITVLGPNDKDWRTVPEDKDDSGPRVVQLRSKE